MTWHDLTFTGSHVLTASDMNRVQENFTALALGHAGAPALAVNSFMASGVASLGTLHVSSGMYQAGAFLIPPGAVIPFTGISAPTGWLLCDGGAVSRANYSDLYAVIGDTFGAGDGSTTFNVPDLRGRTVVALDNLGGSGANRIVAGWADSLGGTGGEETHVLAAAELPSHQHTVRGDTNMSAGGSARRMRPAGTGGTNSDILTEAAGGDQPHNNLQPTMALAYIIKT